MATLAENDLEAVWRHIRARYSNESDALGFAIRSMGLGRAVESPSARQALRDLEDRDPTRLREILRSATTTLKTRRAKPREAREWEILFGFAFGTIRRRLESVRRLTRKAFLKRVRGRRVVDEAAALRFHAEHCAALGFPCPPEFEGDLTLLRAKDARRSDLRRSIGQIAESAANQFIRGMGYGGPEMQWARVRKAFGASAPKVGQGAKSASDFKMADVIERAKTPE